MRPRLLAAVLAVVVLLLGLVLYGGPLRDRAEQGHETASASTLVLLTIDTLRRDHVHTYAPEGAGSVGLTPNLDALAARGLLFEDARTPVPLTLPAHTTLLAGLPPAVTGVRVNANGHIPDAEARGFPFLQERLRAAGWRTGAFVSASPLATSYGLDAGFERYDAEGLDNETGLVYAERPGEETVQRALAWLGEFSPEERVFLWVHLFEPHAPYAPDAGRPLRPDQGYALDVLRADAIAGRLFAGLKAVGRADATLLVTSDHGEALDELGERTHGLLLGDAVLRVPFLLAGKGLAAGHRADPVDLADIAPTLAGIAGLTWPAPTGRVGEGRDLLRGPAPETRIRVAESLYAHHLHGWAQVLGAVAPDGSTLIDVGLDRLWWLERPPFGEPQGGPGAAAGRAGLGPLGGALRAYRQGERAERISGGGVAAGYGHAARVAPFLPSADNARLPDPYDAIARHFALDMEKQRLLSGTPPMAVIRRLEAMSGEDPTDPEVRFWLGRAWQRRAETTRRDGDAAEARRRGAEAYLAAWERGRRDARTLVVAVGIDAAGHESDALRLLEHLAAELPADCQLLILKAKLLFALGRAADAKAACRDAEAVCRTPRERKLLEHIRTRETCR